MSKNHNIKKISFSNREICNYKRQVQKEYSEEKISEAGAIIGDHSHIYVLHRSMMVAVKTIIKGKAFPHQPVLTSRDVIRVIYEQVIWVTYKQVIWIIYEQVIGVKYKQVIGVIYEQAIRVIYEQAIRVIYEQVIKVIYEHGIIVIYGQVIRVIYEQVIRVIYESQSY